jgi:hypothetical protein
MHRRSRVFQLLCLTVLGFTTTALAQETPVPPADSVGAMPAPLATPAAAPGLDTGAVPAAEEAVAVDSSAANTATTTNFAKFGLAVRARWISVPSSLLGLFTKKNVPLSTYGYALEGFRRKHDKDDHNHTWELSVAIGYQNMSPPDGYWLGTGKDITADTDLVQFRNFSLITMDAAFISRQYFSPYFGIHYGAGLGLGVVRGKVLRTSAQCDPTTGKCKVVMNEPAPNKPNTQIVCGGAGQPACTETNLSNSEGAPDLGPGEPHRFQETSVPGAVPIINILFGLDFPVPDAKGLEFRIDAGFYDAFFIGGSAGYLF